MLTPDQIESREFLVSVRGYDRDEVHAFLTEVAQTLRGLQKARPAAAGDQEPSAMFAHIAKETQRILEAAQEAGERIKRQAKHDADRELKDARGRADKLIADGERRREQLEAALAGLIHERDRLAGELRTVGRTLEQTLRTLSADEPAPTVREALTAPVQPEPAEPLVSEEMPVAQPDEPVAQADEPLVSEEMPVAQADEDNGPADAQAVRAEALSPLHPKLVRKVKRGLQDLQNAALDRLRRSGGGAEPDDFMPTDEEVRIVGLMATEFLDEAYTAGVAAAAELAGRALPEPTEPRNLEQDFVTEVAERIRAPLSATLRMGLSTGQAGAELNDRMGVVFGELKNVVAEELAATHLISAYETGLLDTWAAGGLSARRWVLGKEPRCPEARCRHNDQSGSVPLDEPFPSGDRYPPVHPGCNCTTVPVLEGVTQNT